MLSLTEIANKYGTDKGTAGPSAEWSAHNYTDVYEAYFEKMRETPLSILEIGMGVPGNNWPTRICHGKNTGGGASIKMWHDYFSNGRIYGADINPAPHLDNDRIKTFVFDQGNIEQLQAFGNSINNMQFDIIIDDGSHRPDHQQVSLGYFFKLLKSGGLYIIEDLINNGLGDADLVESGMHGCGDVKNTRSVLKHFQKTGTFPTPNVLFEPEYLAQNIECFRFHVPQRVPVPAKVRWQRLKARLTGKLMRYRWQEDSEKVCIIRKK